jgi:hypothetical protein
MSIGSLGPTPRRGLCIAFAAGTALTTVAAWPVVRHPATRLFGTELVGRHHDAYTVIGQFGGNSTSGVYAQILTDRVGWLLARVVDPVVAYNLLILASFPLAVLTTYALARYLFADHGASLVAGVAFAFSPIHLAHAAYHPQVAQVEWMPLYLLALFAFVDRPSLLRAGGVAAAAVALTLSNFYGGLIGAVMTPLATLAYWWASPRGPRRIRNLATVAGTLSTLAAIGAIAVMWIAPIVLSRSNPYAVPLGDLTRYSARWWTYFVPPVDHPQFGAQAFSLLGNNGITLGLLENQVSLGFALLALSAAGAALAFRTRGHDAGWRTDVALVAIGLTAAGVSIGPGDAGCLARPWTPACLIYGVLPMFRAYARFGFVTQLAVTLLAGAGAARLARVSSLGRVAAALLLAIATFEACPFPWRSHDVLPTQAHRWLADRPSEGRILDCVNRSPEDQTVPLLMKRPIEPLGVTVSTCADPDLGPRLAALGFAHVIVRHDADVSVLANHPSDWIVKVATLRGGDVYSVTRPAPPLVIMSRVGFFGPESEGGLSWQWMGPTGAWTVRNTTAANLAAWLSVRLWSGQVPRTMTFVMDDAPPMTAAVETSTPGIVRVGPWDLSPGEHHLEFRPSGSPFRPSDAGAAGDDRWLTVRFLGERWFAHDRAGTLDADTGRR